jgi:nucleotide-binding universal stress UspA family protein
MWNLKPNLKVLWSIDAFDDLSELQARAVRLLEEFSVRFKIEIEPVYVVSPDQLGIQIGSSPEWSERYAPAVRKALEQKLQGIQLAGIKSPRILVHHRFSLKGTVGVLTKHAAAQGCDLILVGSHGRKGLERMILGSFAEELLLQSEIPVLVIGASSENATGGLRHILFPTDLSDSSSVVFQQVLLLAKALGVKITLLHVIPKPIEAIFQSGVYLLSGGWVSVPIYLQQEQVKQESIAEKWKEAATQLGISLETIMDSSSMSVVDSILKHTKTTDVSFVAMAAESGPLESVLMGSITRQVVRLSPCPVWVLRPNKQ